MTSPHRTLLAAAIVAAFASLAVYAQQARRSGGLEALERNTADIPAHRAQQRLAQRAGAPDAAKALTDEQVGDAESYGRNVVWLGLTDMSLQLLAECPTPAEPDAACVTLAPAPASTPFAFEDLGHVTLPGKSAHSLLCYWFSPVLNVVYRNPGAAPALGRLSYSPTLTIESPVLDDPALIDPSTGLPFAGRLTTSMTASERFEVPLAAGQQLIERSRDSAVCIAGFITRKALVQTYGLTDAQAKEFFKKKITVRLNITGSAQYVADASLYYGLRIVGDERND